MRRHTAAIGLALLLGACTAPMHWEHPELGTSRLADDLTDCSRSAHLEVARYSAADYAPRVTRGPDGRVSVEPAPARPDPYAQEAQLRDYCMRAKGYKLVPDKPSPGG